MARTLSLLGAALPERLMAPLDYNPSGVWEPWTIAALNDEILQALDSEWDDVFAFRPRPYLSNFDHYYLGRAVDLLEQEFNGSDLIVLKDPRISILTNFWERALRQAGYAIHYIVMVRNPLEVAESLRARNEFPREKSLMLWGSYMIAVDRDTRERERTFVAYDQLMTDWRSVKRRIGARTGVPFPRDTAAAAIEIDRHLDRGLRHHSIAPDDFFENVDIPPHVKTIYRIFADACEDAEVDGNALKDIELQLARIDQLVGPLLSDLKSSARKLTQDVAELTRAVEDADSRANAFSEQLQTTESHAANLAQQLESERVERRQLSESAEAHAAVLESERMKLVAELEDKQSQVGQLLDESGAAEQKAAQAAAELELEREYRGVEKSRADELETQLQNERQQNSALRDELCGRDLQIIGIKAELSSATDALACAETNLQRATTRLADDDRRLNELVDEISSARKTNGELDGRLKDLGRELSSAKTAKADLEGRMAAHFHETAALSRMILERDERSVRDSARAARLRDIYDALASAPRWWSILPHAKRSQLSRARLSRLGLFDAQAYLQKNPDVAAAGEDPLHHYLHHGIDEERPI